MNVPPLRELDELDVAVACDLIDALDLKVLENQR
jgi:hypothetical protein